MGANPQFIHGKGKHMVSTRLSAFRTTAFLGLTFLVVAGLPGPAHAKKGNADRVEIRIKSLHSSLHITAAQEPLWENVANAMRDNAKAMVAAREQEPARGSAIDELNAYGAIIDAHADGIHKFIPVFQALYDSMSDAQKKSADTIFGEHVRQAARRDH